MHARVFFFFFDGWVKMGNQATDFCIFVKEYLPMKDSDEDIVKWRAKKQNLLVYQK